MMWANTEIGREEATPGAKGTCPCCGGGVIAKCGNLVSWHWAHVHRDCDPWYEPETDWHKAWKASFPKEWQEVVCGPHRADVKTPELVVEFQKSHLSLPDLKAREAFYNRMAWVLHEELITPQSFYGPERAAGFLLDWRNHLHLLLPRYWRQWGRTAVARASRGDYEWCYLNFAVFTTFNKTWVDSGSQMFIDFGSRLLAVSTFASDTIRNREKKVFGRWVGKSYFVDCLKQSRAAAVF